MVEPTTVRIGPFDYEIRWMDRSEEEDGQRFGSHNSNSLIIRLVADRKRQRVASTFLHEVLHSIGHVYGPVENKEGLVKEEDQVDACSYGLSAFPRDNPETWAWWMDLATHDPGKQHVRNGEVATDG
jgi:hypothetical protein